ncbi:COG3650 family protein, partial [Paracoccus angustae]
MTPRLALIALMTLPLAACEGVDLPGLRTSAPQAEGHKGPPGVSPLEQPIETGAEARPVSTAEPSTYNTAAFSARGNEPFWAVDVAGGTAIYKTPDNQKGRPIRVNRLVFAQGVEYVGVHAGRPFALNVRAAECRDGMSGQDFPFTARLTVSGRTETGCASAATAEVAQAVAATRAPAPAAPRQATAARRPAA